MTYRRSTQRLLLALLLLPLLLAAACQAGDPASIEEGERPRTEDQVPRMTPDELKALLDAGEEVVIADSRALTPYNVRHITGAISMPLAEVEERADELPRDRTIVFYCT
jgi:hypothetical protein